MVEVQAQEVSDHPEGALQGGIPDQIQRTSLLEFLSNAKIHSIYRV
jgi:hypothetical protein